MMRFLRALISIAACSALLHANALATTTAVHGIHLQVAPRAPSGPHGKPGGRGHPLAKLHIFGTIMGINGNMLSVLRRNGKYVTVDATTAIANNDYSYPLFIGKTVAIDGAFSSKTTFTATHVFAITTLQSLESDSSD